MHIAKLDDIVKAAIEREMKIVACANPTDAETLEALREAETRKIVHCILVGKKDEDTFYFCFKQYGWGVRIEEVRGDKITVYQYEN